MLKIKCNHNEMKVKVYFPMEIVKEIYIDFISAY